MELQGHAMPLDVDQRDLRAWKLEKSDPLGESRATATELGKNRIDYRTRLHDIWQDTRPDFERTPQQLSGQVRAILRRKALSEAELEALKQEVSAELQNDRGNGRRPSAQNVRRTPTQAHQNEPVANVRMLPRRSTMAAQMTNEDTENELQLLIAEYRGLPMNVRTAIPRVAYSKYTKTIYLVISLIATIATCDEKSVPTREKELSNLLQTIEDTPSISVIEDLVVLEKSNSTLISEARGDEDIVDRCARFLAERELKIKLPTSEARDLLSAESRGKKKRIARILLPILLLLKVKAAIILPIILSIIALVSFKGFGLSLAALAVAGSTAFKNILEHVGSKSISYEVVPSPVGHWSRSGNVEGTLPLGYQL
ncbi:unnamed protein product [Ceutorhynchus assimilis]|uniref:Uncharacterized protein n=1 Tax=Ceutorhynchus assimilis TaxID=467358 RepID=A0A9N9QJ48_9CUCU|nr:unnamed protein product [Ceutorhynchus assimilis]